MTPLDRVCPLCGSALTIYTDGGAEVGAACTACKWQAPVEWKLANLKHPWGKQARP